MVLAFLHSMWSLSEKMEAQGRLEMAALLLVSALANPVNGMGDKQNCHLFASRGLSEVSFPPHLRWEELQTRLKAVSLLLDCVEMNQAEISKETEESFLHIASELLAPLFCGSSSLRCVSADPQSQRGELVDEAATSKRMKLEDGDDTWYSIRRPRCSSWFKCPFLVAEPCRLQESDYFFNPADIVALAWAKEELTIAIPSTNGKTERELFWAHSHDCGLASDNARGRRRPTPFALLLRGFVLLARWYRLRGQPSPALDVLERAESRLKECFKSLNGRQFLQQLSRRLHTPGEEEAECSASWRSLTNGVHFNHALQTVLSHENYVAEVMLSVERCQVLADVLVSLSNHRTTQHLAFKIDNDRRESVSLLLRYSSICFRAHSWLKVTEGFEDSEAVMVLNSNPMHCPATMCQCRFPASTSMDFHGISATSALVRTLRCALDEASFSSFCGNSATKNHSLPLLLRHLGFYHVYAFSLSRSLPISTSVSCHAELNAQSVQDKITACSDVGRLMSNQPCEGSTVDEFTLFVRFLSLLEGGRSVESQSEEGLTAVNSLQQHWTSARWRNIVGDYVGFLRASCVLAPSRRLKPMGFRRQTFSKILEVYSALVQQIDGEMASTHGREVQSATFASFHGVRYANHPLDCLSFLLSLKSSAHLQMAATSLQTQHLMEAIQCLAEWRHSVQVFSGPLAPMRIYGHLLIAMLSLQMGITDMSLHFSSRPSGRQGSSLVKAAHEAFTPLFEKAAGGASHADGCIQPKTEEEEDLLSEASVAEMVGIAYYHLLSAEAAATGSQAAFAVSTFIATSSSSLILLIQLMKLFAIYITASTRARFTLSGCNQSQSETCLVSSGQLQVHAHAATSVQHRCQKVFRSKIAVLLESLQQVLAEEQQGGRRRPSVQGLDSLASASAAGAWTPTNRCLVYLLHGLFAASEEHDPFLAEREYRRALETVGITNPTGNATDAGTPSPVLLTAVQVDLYALLFELHQQDASVCGASVYSHALQTLIATTLQPPSEQQSLSIPSVSAMQNQNTPQTTPFSDLASMQHRWRVALLQICGEGIPSQPVHRPSTPHVLLHSILAFLPHFQGYDS